VPCYFAYGSNMAAAVLRSRVGAEPVGRAVLRGYRLAFTLPSQRWGGRAADIVPDDGAEVWGRLWSVDDEGIAVLDGYEAAYRRVVVGVERVDGGGLPAGRVDAVTYVVREERRAPDDGDPHPGYRAHLVTGAEECGLPDAYTRQLRGPGEG
jgi:gamma-glutamylcyclotransferase